MVPPNTANVGTAGLTLKQELFVKEYLVDFNATRAAKAAGYSEKTAEAAGSRLLRNVKVRTEIEKQTSERAKRLDITADKVLQELARIAFSNILDFVGIAGREAYVDFSRLTRDQAAAVQEITSEVFVSGTDDEHNPIEVKRTKFKLSDKRAALELLGKHLKLWTDKQDVNHSGSIQLTDSQFFERMSAAELKAYAEKGMLPDWFTK